jgi:hypothetical protein
MACTIPIDLRLRSNWYAASQRFPAKRRSLSFTYRRYLLLSLLVIVDNVGQDC